MKKILVLLTILFLSVSAYCASIPIKNDKGEIIGKLTLISKTRYTYNIYDNDGKKIGIYKRSTSLTKTRMKGKKFRLVKIGDTYTIKE